MVEPVVEFMRYSAPDAQALARGIEELRGQLEQALAANDPRQESSRRALDALERLREEGLPR